MKSFEERLASESAGWVESGLVTREQRAGLLARHPLGESGASRFLAILASIGGALVIAGVALLIAAHWREISDWTKIGGLVALLLLSHGAGWRLRISPGKFPRLGDACFMVGSVLFFLGIALVSQIFHLNSRPANGVLLWWIGIAALPWLLRDKGTQCVSVIALLIWLSLEMSASDSWLRLGADIHHSSGMWYGVAAFLIGVALFFTGLAMRRDQPPFAGLHEGFGLLVLNLSLYALSFAWSRHAIVYSDVTELRWLPFVIFAVVAGLALGWAWRANRADVGRIALWLSTGLVPAAGFLFGGNEHAESWLWGAAAGVSLFVVNVGMIRAGVATGRESWINLGVGFVALNIVTRYIDLFGTMLEGGVFFLITGVMVLGLGFYLERKRRSLVAGARKEAA
jgi:uncharacterized membrane protein